MTSIWHLTNKWVTSVGARHFIFVLLLMSGVPSLLTWLKLSRLQSSAPNWIIVIVYCMEYLQKNISRLQRIQNNLARVVVRQGRYASITPVFAGLHWLPIAWRIDFKLYTLVYKVRLSMQPVYLASCLTESVPTRTLRSASLHLLTVPRVRTVAASRQFWSVAAPTVWNRILCSIRDSETLAAFKNKLKLTILNWPSIRDCVLLLHALDSTILCLTFWHLAERVTNFIVLYCIVSETIVQINSVWPIVIAFFEIARLLMAGTPHWTVIEPTWWCCIAVSTPSYRSRNSWNDHEHAAGWADAAEMGKSGGGGRTSCIRRNSMPRQQQLPISVPNSRNVLMSVVYNLFGFRQTNTLSTERPSG